MRRVFVFVSVLTLPLLAQPASTRRGIDNDAAVLAEVVKKGGYGAKGATVKFRTDWGFFDGKAQRGLEVAYPKKGPYPRVDEDTVEYSFDLKAATWVFHSVTHGDTKLIGFQPPSVDELDQAAFTAIASIPEKIINAGVLKDIVHVFAIRTVASGGKPGKLEVIDENTIQVRVEIEFLKKSGKEKCRVAPQLFWSNLTLKKQGSAWVVTGGEWEGRSVKESKFYDAKPTKEECGALPVLGKIPIKDMYGTDRLPPWYRK